jgi:thiamine-monophosphate kinase
MQNKGSTLNIRNEGGARVRAGGQGGAGASHGAAGEFALHERIARIVGAPAKNRVATGIGDDAAVLAALDGHPICSDAIVEGTHFDLRWSSPADLAWKALGSCLSDLAAMGARPIATTISLALPASRSSSRRKAGPRRENRAAAFIDGFYGEARAICERYALDVAGGDLVASPGPIFIDVAAIGCARRPVLRSTAKNGDWLAVSGSLGGAAAGLEALRRGFAREATLEPIGAAATAGLAALIERQLRPRPRLDLLCDLDRASAAIDLSDGLIGDASRLARASGIGLVVREAAIPLAAATKALARALAVEPLAWALAGGEDYEILASFSEKNWLQARQADATFAERWTPIGRCRPASEGLRLEAGDGALRAWPNGGFDHFLRGKD